MNIYMKTNVFFKCLKGVVLLLASLKGWFLGQKCSMPDKSSQVKSPLFI